MSPAQIEEGWGMLAEQKTSFRSDRDWNCRVKVHWKYSSSFVSAFSLVWRPLVLPREGSGQIPFQSIHINNFSLNTATEQSNAMQERNSSGKHAKPSSGDSRSGTGPAALYWFLVRLVSHSLYFYSVMIFHSMQFSIWHLSVNCTTSCNLLIVSTKLFRK